MNAIVKLVRTIAVIFFLAALGNTFISSDQSLGNSQNDALVKPDTKDKFEIAAQELYNSLNLSRLSLDYPVFRQALLGYYNLLNKELIEKSGILSIIDFEKPSTDKRLFVVDLEAKKLLHNTLVSHGKNSGWNYASKYSNKPNSLQSSIGLFKAAETYVGKHGFSLRLDGLEKGVNHKARDRAIVVHGADYVSETFIQKWGRLGRSFGCPALPQSEHKQIINHIKDGTCLFIFKKDSTYLRNSDFFNLDNAETALEEESA